MSSNSPSPSPSPPKRSPLGFNGQNKMSLPLRPKSGLRESSPLQVDGRNEFDDVAQPANSRLSWGPAPSARAEGSVQPRGRSLGADEELLFRIRALESVGDELAIPSKMAKKPILPWPPERHDLRTKSTSRSRSSLGIREPSTPEDSTIMTTEADESSGDTETSSDEEPITSRRKSFSKRKVESADDSDDESDEEPSRSRADVGLRPSSGSRPHSRSPYRTMIAIAPPDMKMISKRANVRPATNYHVQKSSGESDSSSGSESDEDMDDIRRAQRKAFKFSAIESPVPNLSVRSIYRGEYGLMQKQAEFGTRRLRTYLVASDLSDEAAYALEWTIGTVLRDGDTLLALYAVDQEVGTGRKPGPETPTNAAANVVTPGTAASQATPVKQETQVTGSGSETLRPGIRAERKSSLGTFGKSISRSNSVDGRKSAKAEEDRIHAVDEITQTCVKLLSKTKLQVRVAIEVIQCANPKHLIVEAIDQLEPTLVVAGSRGQGALKGVLLGSFSNYLVTKSSVPVMVARKKLQEFVVKKKGNLTLEEMRKREALPLAEANVDGIEPKQKQPHAIMAGMDTLAGALVL